ncbi:MAG TPA: GntR family transcriptional regulator [Anaerolineaceae bacterium]|nr:GntR family transcriptional regulator [Anaerolineaceae bacterium]HPN52353.1 GntR family transcriptional regulator [Anaerolineaceae bacterium]
MDFSSLNKESSEQLYLQIRRIILRAIRSQDLLPQQRVPSATELSELTGVSRMTVRQALQTLINEGWLYTVTGKGTFVADRPRIEQNLLHLMGWTEEIRQQHLEPSTKIISVEAIPADRSIANNLNIPLGNQVYRITRVRYADHFPLSIEKAHLSCDKFQGLDLLVKSMTSLYQTLRENFEVYPVRAVQVLDAGEADQQISALLEMPIGKPVLLSERTTYASGDEAIEFVLGIHKPGFVRFVTELNSANISTQQIILNHNQTDRR